MDFLTFLVRLAEALAWPAVVAFAFWHVRGAVGTLIGRLIKLRWKDAEAAFSEQLDQVERGLPEPPPRETKKLDVPALVAQAELPPAYIIQQAYLRLKEALRRAALKRGLDPKDYRSPRSMADALQLPGPDTRLLHHLSLLRNKVVHGLEPEITPTDALRYRDLAERVAEVIEKRDVPPLQSAG